MAPERKQLAVTFEFFEKSELERLRKSFPGYAEGAVKGNPGGFVMTPGYAERAEDIYNFEVRPDDTWVVTFPKCGTTWTQDMVWLISNDYDFEKARSRPLDYRFPFLEMSLLMPKDSTADVKADKVQSEQEDFIIPFDKIASLPSPRFIKSHLPLYLLPHNLLETAKVVYVARNPKDVIVSSYYHYNLFKHAELPIGMEQFAEHCLNDEVLCSPFFAHVLEAWNKRNHPNLLFIFYEDMKVDLAGQIRRVAEFLDKPLSEENLSKLLNYLHFDNFSKNESVNLERFRKAGMLNEGGKFIRKGKTGDWKNHFSPELSARIDAWMEKNLQGTDLRFVTQLEKQD